MNRPRTNTVSSDAKICELIVFSLGQVSCLHGIALSRFCQWDWREPCVNVALTKPSRQSLHDPLPEIGPASRRRPGICHLENATIPLYRVHGKWREQDQGTGPTEGPVPCPSPTRPHYASRRIRGTICRRNAGSRDDPRAARIVACTERPTGDPPCVLQAMLTTSSPHQGSA